MLLGEINSKKKQQSENVGVNHLLVTLLGFGSLWIPRLKLSLLLFADTKRQGMRLMHSAGFVDILKYYASAALFTSSVLLLWVVVKCQQLAKNISLCRKWITDYQKLSSKSRKLRAKTSNKHEINSPPVDTEMFYICTFSNIQVFCNADLVISPEPGSEKDLLVVAVHHHLLPFVLSSLACWQWWFLSEYFIPLSLPLS